jgi:hypothetical protein
VPARCGLLAIPRQVCQKRMFLGVAWQQCLLAMKVAIALRCKIILHHLRPDNGEAHNVSVKADAIRTENRTRDLRNMKLKC